MELHIVLAEVGDSFVVGRKPPGQPHHFEIAAGLALQPTARLHTIEIAINVKLQQHSWAVPGAASGRRLDAVKAECAQIQRINEHIDCAHGVILVNPVFKAFRQKGRLPPIHPATKPAIRTPTDSVG